MSFKVKVIIDEEERNVLSYSFNLSKGKDVNGKPTTKTVLHKLNLKLESNNKTDLMEWMLSPNQTKQIELHIQARQGEKTRILYFFDAVLVGLETTFSATGNTPMTDDLQITAAGLNTNDSTTEYSAYWRTTYLNKGVEPTTIDNSPELIQYFITDLQGNEIDKYEVSDKIILNLETKNSIGENLTVKIPDKTYDFKHNGIHLQNDTLKDYRINDDLEKVELEVIEQQS